VNASTISSQKNRVVWQFHRSTCLFIVVAALFAGFAGESQAQINAPTNLAANATVPETVTLTWQDNSSNEGNFELQYRFGGGPTFATLTQLLRELAEEHCHGRLISTLEGGYNLAGLSSAVVSHVKALL
jgi:hypothetical protein